MKIFIFGSHETSILEIHKSPESKSLFWSGFGRLAETWGYNNQNILPFFSFYTQPVDIVTELNKCIYGRRFLQVWGKQWSTAGLDFDVATIKDSLLLQYP